MGQSQSARPIQFGFENENDVIERVRIVREMKFGELLIRIAINRDGMAELLAHSNIIRESLNAPGIDPLFYCEKNFHLETPSQELVDRISDRAARRVLQGVGGMNGWLQDAGGPPAPPPNIFPGPRLCPGASWQCRPWAATGAPRSRRSLPRAVQAASRVELCRRGRFRRFGLSRAQAR